MRAFESGNKEEALSLLPEVSHPHLIRDRRSYTLLHRAASKGWADLCRVLVEQYHCKADVTDGHGRSALHLACGNGHVSVVKYLLTLESVLATLSNRSSGGNTSMELVTSNKYEIFSIFASHLDLKMELHVSAFFKLFMAGK